MCPYAPPQCTAEHDGSSALSAQRPCLNSLQISDAYIIGNYGIAFLTLLGSIDTNDASQGPLPPSVIQCIVYHYTGAICC